VRRFAETASATSLRDGCAETLGDASGESFSDQPSKSFESPGLPSYQHFRPSMMRYDHHFPFELEGFAALHCCFASACGIPNNNNTATKAVRVVDEGCVLI
jgi:hypothetical protein